MKGLQLTAFSPKKVSGLSGDDDAREDERLLSPFDAQPDSPHFRRIQVRVTGMTCAACSNSVESALSALNGVVKASVALLQNKADVTFDPALLKVLSSLNFLCLFLSFFLCLFL